MIPTALLVIVVVIVVRLLPAVVLLLVTIILTTSSLLMGHVTILQSRIAATATILVISIISVRLMLTLSTTILSVMIAVLILIRSVIVLLVPLRVSVMLPAGLRGVVVVLVLMMLLGRRSALTTTATATAAMVIVVVATAWLRYMMHVLLIHVVILPWASLTATADRGLPTLLSLLLFGNLFDPANRDHLHGFKHLHRGLIQHLKVILSHCRSRLLVLDRPLGW